MTQTLRYACLFIFSLPCFAFGAWPNDLREDADLRCVSFVDDQFGWCVGDRGTILATRDGGRSWRLQNCPIPCNLNSVHFVDRRTGWAAGGYTIPFLSRSQGVVIHTIDGGKSWTQLDTSLLAEIGSIHFFDKARGYILSNRSLVHPSGVLTTKNGGQSWSPNSSSILRDCVNGQFTSLSDGLAVDRLGQVNQVTRGKSTLVESRSKSHLRNVQILSATDFIACGDDGVIVSSHDGGRNWQLPNAMKTVPAIDFRAIETDSTNCWIAGSPGTIIMHSSNSGRNWRPIETPTTLPILDLEFQNETTGWAVGALGLIIHTNDGGRNWKFQRGGNRRVATMPILPHPSTVSWADLANHSTIDGLRSRFLFLNSPSTLRIGRTSDHVRVHEALVSLGAGCSQPLTDQTLFDVRTSVPINQLLPKTASIGTTLDAVTARISKEIRIWRPSVIQLQRPEAGHIDAHRIIHDVTRKAIDQAANPNRNTLRLPAWKVNEVWFAESSTSFNSASNDGLELLSGWSANDLAAQARNIAETGSPVSQALQPARVDRFTTADRQTRSIRQLVNSESNSRAFRRTRLPLPTDVSAKQKQFESRRNLERIMSRDMANGTATISEQMTNFPDDLRGQFLFKSAQNAFRSGDFELAEQMLQQLIVQLNQHRLAEPAAVALIQNLVSEEITIATKANSSTNENTADSSRGPRAQLISVKSSPRWKTASTKIQSILAMQPMWNFLPEMQFPYASLKRRFMMSPRVDRFFENQAASQRDFTWRTCARCENWLANPKNTALLRPIAHCVWSPVRPKLDGHLDEPVWKNCPPVELHDKDIASHILFFFDSKFLYIGVTSQKVPSVEYAVRKAERDRDAHLERSDHIQFAFDVDRDFSTYWLLGIDHQGRCYDRLHTYVGWNPKWYIATSEDENMWTVEVAIPLSQLTVTKNTQKAWNMGIRRNIPRVGAVDWPARPRAAEYQSPSEMGVLIFDGAD